MHLRIVSAIMRGGFSTFDDRFEPTGLQKTTKGHGLTASSKAARMGRSPLM